MDIRAFFGHKYIMNRTRKDCAINEAKDIELIINSINSRNPTGSRLLETFTEKFGSEITSARKRNGSSRGTHYDFEIEVDGEWKKVEHKGGQLYRLPQPEEVPWKVGVQFHNGGCEKYSIARKFARLWYDMYIDSGSLKQEFEITESIPSFEEWFEKDCRTQDDPKTPFGKELKSKVRKTRGPTASLLEKREAVLEALEITEQDKTILISDVLSIVNEILVQKQYWLSIHGNLESEFYTVWYPQFTISSIQDVIIRKKRDLEFTFVCVNDYTFHGILRWGKGAGFSCLRVDLK